MAILVCLTPFFVKSLALELYAEDDHCMVIETVIEWKKKKMSNSDNT